MPRIALHSVRQPTILVYQNAAGEWCWRLKATNGEIQASGEGYRRRSGALQGVKAFQRNARIAVVVIEQAG